ncbi:MAG: FAD-binding oxidoreductase, partial [Chloroflexi bacterium]|nr:FAD-binding oxidoreductase [Chloroflexota bacterium]
MDGKQQAYLEKQFRRRVTFNRTELRLYGHDIAAMPGLVAPLVGDTTPEAVVQPQTEEELIELALWANEHGVALTPRGKASSGYGGVLPVKGGVVVDFYRMNRMIGIDREGQTATVEAGVVWERLDRDLARQGLTLRLYPTSYRSSTVGGWLAQGGAGIGSYEMGWFRDSVVSARVVLPDGNVRELKGDDLDFIADAEGITGFISQVTLRVQPQEDLKVIAVASPGAYSLQRLLQSFIDEKLPLWSVLFVNPRMAELKNKVPLMERHGQAEDRVLLPEAYILSIAFRAKDRQAIMDRLPRLLRACDSELLGDEVAQHEWENRFRPLDVKRLGPSLVPSEVVVPLYRLADAVVEMESRVRHPLVKEAIVIRESASGRPEVVILGFIPADQRRFDYNFIFGLSLSVLKVAEKYGGRPYSTGLYWAREARRVLGAERVAALKDFKARVDPRNIMNPGKVTAGGRIGAFIGLARAFEPVIRMMGNRATLSIGERPDKPVRGIPADVAWYAYGCSQCGSCIEECDQFYGRGWESQSPRGKWYWLRQYMEGREEWDQSMVDTILSCTTCELCNLRCSAGLPIESSWLKLRGQLIREQNKMTFPPFEMMAQALESEGNIWAGYRKDRDQWFPEELMERHGPRIRGQVSGDGGQGTGPQPPTPNPYTYT